VPAMDVLVVLGGVACIVSSVIALRSQQAGGIIAGAIVQPAE
jgi:hypothetical protein